MPLDLDLSKGAKGQKEHAWAAYFTLHPRQGYSAPEVDHVYGDKSLGVVMSLAAKYMASGRQLKKFWIAKELADFAAAKQAMGGNVETANAFLGKVAATGCEVVFAPRLKVAADAAMRRVDDIPAGHINRIREVQEAVAEAVKAPESTGGISAVDAAAHARAEKLQADRQNRPALVVNVPEKEPAQKIVMVGTPGAIRHEIVLAPTPTKGLVEVTAEKQAALLAAKKTSLTDAEKASRKKMREGWDKVHPEYMDAAEVILNRYRTVPTPLGTKVISALPEDMDAEHKPISTLLTMGKGGDPAYAFGALVTSQGFYPRFYTSNFAGNKMLWGGNDPETTLSGKRPILDLGPFYTRELRKEWDRVAWRIAAKEAAPYHLDKAGVQDLQIQILDAMEDYAKVYDPSRHNQFHIFAIGQMEGYAKNVIRELWQSRAPDEAELGADPGDEPNAGMARMPTPEEEYGAKEAEAKVPGLLGSASDVTERMDSLLSSGKITEAADLVVGARAEVAKEYATAYERLKDAQYDKDDAERAYLKVGKKFPQSHETVETLLHARDDERAAYDRVKARGEVHKILQEHQRTGTPTGHTVDAVRRTLAAVVATHWLSAEEGAVFRTALRLNHDIKQSTEIETTSRALAARGNGVPLKLPTPKGQPQRYLAATVTGVSGKEHNLLPAASEIHDALVALGVSRNAAERDWQGYWNKAVEKLDRMPRSQRDAMREVLAHARNLAMGKRQAIVSATSRSTPTIKLPKASVQVLDAALAHHEEEIAKINKVVKQARLKSNMLAGQYRVEGSRLRTLVNARAEKIAAAEGFQLWETKRPEATVAQEWHDKSGGRTVKVKPVKETIGGKARFYVVQPEAPAEEPVEGAKKKPTLGQAAYKLARSKSKDVAKQAQKVGASFENTSEYDVRRGEIFKQAFDELVAEDPAVAHKRRRFAKLHAQTKKLEARIDSHKNKIAHHESRVQELKVARAGVLAGEMAPHDPDHLIWRLRGLANRLRGPQTWADRLASQAFDRAVVLASDLSASGDVDPDRNARVAAAMAQAKRAREVADLARDPKTRMKLKEIDAAIEAQRTQFKKRQPVKLYIDPSKTQKSLSSLVGDYLDEIIHLDRVLAWT